jgi:hypothetical protein
MLGYLHLPLVALLALSSYANACSCMAVDIEKTYLLANSVFSAKITGQRIIKRDGDELVSSDFSVVKVVKGNPGNIKNITSFTSSSSCWKPLVTGETYLFYASSRAEIFYSKCSPHKPVGPGNVSEY